MRSNRSLVVSLCIVLLFVSTAVSFALPYVHTTPNTQIDLTLPIDSVETYTFSNSETTEQWQITPLSRIYATLVIPTDIYIAVQHNLGQRLFLITRRTSDSNHTSDVLEFYARNEHGDFLVGRVADGIVTPYNPNILVRPQDASLERWNQSFTDGAGTITATQQLTEDGCRLIHIDGRDLTGWRETICDTMITSQARNNAAPLLLSPVLTNRNIHNMPTVPDANLVARAQLQRIGNLQIRNNNEKVIAPLLVLQSEQLLVGTVSGGTLGAMRIADGSYAWTYHVNGDIYGSPSFDQYAGDIIFATTHKEVHTLSAAGMRRWSTHMSDPIVANPCATPYGVLVADTAGNVTLLDSTNGQIRWSQTVGSSVVAAPVYDESSDVLIVASQSGSITAFDRNGGIVWQFENNESILADLTITNGTVYAVGNEGTVTAIASNNGAMHWINAIGAQAQWPVEVQGNNTVVTTPYEIKLLGRDGVVRTTIDAVATAPPRLISNGLIYSTDTEVVLTNFDGKTLTEWTLAYSIARHDSALHSLTISTQPQFDNHNVYLADINGRILTLQQHTSADTLLPKWHQNVSTAPMNSIAIVQSTIDATGNLVVASSTQTVSILEGSTGALLKQFTGFSALPPDAIVATDKAIIIADSIHITAYENSSGKELWTLPATALHAQQLAISGKYLMHLYQSNALQAIISIIDHTTGQIIWSQPYLSSMEQRTGAVDKDAVYINGIFSLSLQDASFRWFSELPLMQQVRTSNAWCGVISIRTDFFSCVDAQTGKTGANQLRVLFPHGQLVANPQLPYIGVYSPFKISMYASSTGDVLWEHTEHTTLQDVIMTDTNLLISVYVDGRITIRELSSGRELGILRDAPIDLYTNSHYGRFNPLLWQNNHLFLVSNTHILAFDIAEFSGASQ